MFNRPLERDMPGIEELVGPRVAADDYKGFGGDYPLATVMGGQPATLEGWRVRGSGAHLHRGI